MRFNKSILFSAALSTLLAGCWLDGGTAYNNYDGVWTVSYTPAKLQCTHPITSITIKNGSGSANQAATTCTDPTIVPAVGVTVTPTVADYQLSAAISGNGVFSAIANGLALTGTCISPQGCSAQGNGTLSMTR